jgi:Uma2 family endonuclease
VSTLHPPPAIDPFTKADWDRLPEGFPAQLVEGWLVKDPSPGYGHQWYAMQIAVQLRRHLPAPHIVIAPFDVQVDDWNVYQPDVVVVRRVPKLDERCSEPPLLVVEVLSPSTAERDRDVKRRHLLAWGTGEVWLVDPAARTIEVHDAEGARSARGADSLGSRVVAGFALVPDVLFAPPA